MSFGSMHRSAVALALAFFSAGCQTDCIMICRQVVLRPEEVAPYDDSEWNVIGRPDDEEGRDRGE